jgi:hypothetical protein
VHFLNNKGKFCIFLLGLPWIEGRHGGENLANRSSEILYEYGIEERTGYFITDNAGSNNTYLKDLGIKLGFQEAVLLASLLWSYY